MSKRKRETEEEVAGKGDAASTDKEKKAKQEVDALAAAAMFKTPRKRDVENMLLNILSVGNDIKESKQGDLAQQKQLFLGFYGDLEDSFPAAILAKVVENLREQGGELASEWIAEAERQDREPSPLTIKEELDGLLKAAKKEAKDNLRTAADNQQARKTFCEEVETHENTPAAQEMLKKVLKDPAAKQFYDQHKAQQQQAAAAAVDQSFGLR